MNTVYLTKVPDPADTIPVRLLRSVRAAMRALHPEATAHDAERCIVSCRERGWGILGTLDGDGFKLAATMSDVRTFLGDDCRAQVDIDTERTEQLHRAKAMTRAGATPEQVFAGDDSEAKVIPITAPFSPAVYETMAAMIAHAEGNPLAAAAQAFTLGRVTGQAEFFADVVKALCKTFPWLDSMLTAQGMNS